MSKIFLDIGAYIGDTAEVVLEKKYGFDKIHCFEPAEVNYSKIPINERIIVHKFGLFNETKDIKLYCFGSNGASIFENKKQPNKEKFPDSKMCSFMRASDWFRQNIKNTDYVIAKINVEGAEIEILDDLLESGEYLKMKSVLVLFDVKKIPGKEKLEDAMIKKTKNIKDVIFVSYRSLRAKLLSEGIKDNQKNRIDYWLSYYGG